MMKVAQRGFWLVGGSYMEIIEPTLEFQHEKCGVCLALTGNEVNRNTIN